MTPASYDHLTDNQRKALCKRYGHKFSYWLIIGQDKCDRCGVLKDAYLAEVRRRPMTDQEKRLIGFYRNERKWHEDIMSRRVAPDRSVVRVPLGKRAPWEH